MVPILLHKIYTQGWTSIILFTAVLQMGKHNICMVVFEVSIENLPVDRDLLLTLTAAKTYISTAMNSTTVSLQS